MLVHNTFLAKPRFVVWNAVNWNYFGTNSAGTKCFFETFNILLIGVVMLRSHMCPNNSKASIDILVSTANWKTTQFHTLNSSSSN